MRKLLLAVGITCVLLGGLAGTAYAGTQSAPAFAPYQIPPQVPPPSSATVRALLQGSSVTARDSWIIVNLQGDPYHIGFQNGYLTAQGDDYNIQTFGTPQDRATIREVAQRYVWPLVPAEYKQELRGIAAGLRAAGYKQDTLWDVVAANAWADEACYATLLPSSTAAARVAAASAAVVAHRKGGCSAFIATGKATTDGRPVMGHETWAGYATIFTNNVMYYVHPTKGYDFTYQSCGGSIWSGEDWYENSAGLLLTETTLADSTYTPTGLPVFVRAREAAQYDATVAQAVHTLIYRNNGAYSNEWLIGDKTGRIASLQLGDKVWDLHAKRSGFFGSSNFDWGTKTRAEEAAADAGWAPDSYDPAGVDYARYRRWGELKNLYYGKIDAKVGMTMESDTYDSYLNTELPDARDLCGEPDHFTPGLLGSDSWVAYPIGATDGKVCTEAMALHGLKSWACWGRGSGDHFDAAAWLKANPDWAAANGPLAVFGLMTFSAQSTDRWTMLKGVPRPCSSVSPPPGSVAVEDITYKMLNCNDGGNVGIWALDNGLCHVQVWRVPAGTFYAAVTESGRWTTFAGALSVGAGVPEPAGGSGPLFAHFTETFPGTITPGMKRFGYLGTINFGETEADILLGTYAKQSGNPNTWDPFNSYYSNVTNVVVLTCRGRESYKNQAFTWTVTNNNYSSTGDIVIPN